MKKPAAAAPTTTTVAPAAAPAIAPVLTPPPPVAFAGGGGTGEAGGGGGGGKVVGDGGGGDATGGAGEATVTGCACRERRSTNMQQHVSRQGYGMRSPCLRFYLVQTCKSSTASMPSSAVRGTVWLLTVRTGMWHAAYAVSLHPRVDRHVRL